MAMPARDSPARNPTPAARAVSTMHLLDQAQRCVGVDDSSSSVAERRRVADVCDKGECDGSAKGCQMIQPWRDGIGFCFRTALGLRLGRQSDQDGFTHLSFSLKPGTWTLDCALTWQRHSCRGRYPKSLIQIKDLPWMSSARSRTSYEFPDRLRRKAGGTAFLRSGTISDSIVKQPCHRHPPVSTHEGVQSTTHANSPSRGACSTRAYDRRNPHQTRGRREDRVSTDTHGPRA